MIQGSIYIGTPGSLFQSIPKSYLECGESFSCCTLGSNSRAPGRFNPLEGRDAIQHSNHESWFTPESNSSRTVPRIFVDDQRVLGIYRPLNRSCWRISMWISISWFRFMVDWWFMLQKLHVVPLHIPGAGIHLLPF